MSSSYLHNKPILFYAKVLSTKDKKKLGRVQISLSNLDKPVKMPWIRVLQSQASAKGKGMVILPEKNDTVVVIRGAGDRIGNMFVLGSAYDKVNAPNSSYAKFLDKNDYKFFTSRTGNEVLLSDEKGKTKIQVKTSKGLTFLMDDKTKSVSFKSVAVKMAMDGKKKLFKVESPDKVIIKGKKINIEASDAVTIKGKTVKISGKMGVKIDGKDVILGAKLNAKVEGTMVLINGKAKADVKAGGMVSVKGAMTKIG